MTTLEQQIEHFKDYWNIPEEELAKLRQLIIEDFINTEMQSYLKFNRDKKLEDYCSQITFDNYHGEVLW